MMASGNILKNKVLPLLVFPAISVLATYIVFGHIYQSGAGDKIVAQCSLPSASRHSQDYTGIPSIDRQLCGLVTCFHVLLEPSHNLPFNVILLTGLAPVAAIPAIEAARRKRHVLLACNVIIALMYQRLTAAVVMPWYWLIFILTGAAGLPRGADAKIDQAHAEAVLFGIVVGYIVPSVGMLVMDNPYVTALWQPFPLWMFAAQYVHLAFRPSSRYPESGYRTIQATYIFLFLFSAIPHIYFVGTIIIAGDYARLGALFVPSLAAPDTSSTIQAAVLDFIQWDIIFALVSMILASLWTAKTITQFLWMSVWFGVAGVVFGPGAAVAGVFSWREGVLNAGIEDGAVEEKKQN